MYRYRPTVLYVVSKHAIAKYSQTYFLDVVHERYGPNIAIRVISLNYNWRGAVAQLSYLNPYWPIFLYYPV